MVITKIEAGKYSIVTAGGMKFTVEKQHSHYWVVKGNGLGAVQATLKECKEWAEQQIEKPAETVKPDMVAEADEPKTNINKVMPDFICGKIMLNTPTKETCNLLVNELARRGFMWLSFEKIKPDSRNMWRVLGKNTCFYTAEGIRVGYGGIGDCKDINPSIPIVTLTTADFDKPKKEFTKADLKTGMVVECQDGERFMVIEGEYECECGCTANPMPIGEDDNWLDGMNTNSNLTNKTDPNYNIDKVYAPKMQGIGRMFDTVSDRDLIWQRKPEYDWSKAEVNMPILVKAKADRFWHKRYFAKYEDGIVFAWTNGRTSWITDEISGWGCAVPYKGNEHLVEGEDK